MRACFLGQSVCALGYGVATIRTLPAEEKVPIEAAPRAEPPAEVLIAIPNRMFEDFKRHPHFS